MTYIKLSSAEFGHTIVKKESSLDLWVRSDRHLVLRSDEVTIDAYFSNCNQKPMINVKLDGNASAVVDANAYELFLEEVKSLPERTEDNQLYSLDRGLMGDIQICGSLARIVKNYNWEQFMPQFIKEFAQKERDLGRLRRNPNIDDKIGSSVAHN